MADKKLTLKEIIAIMDSRKTEETKQKELQKKKNLKQKNILIQFKKEQKQRKVDLYLNTRDRSISLLKILKEHDPKGAKQMYIHPHTGELKKKVPYKDLTSRQKKLRMNKQTKRNRQRRESEPDFKLRESVNRSFTNGLHLDTSKGFFWKAVPYTPLTLREHLESRFTADMNWDNYGDYWHIDHVIPQAALPYDSVEHPNFRKCWALDNLQPLSAEENRTKSSLHEGVYHRYKKNK